ncbi:MAG: transporter substrate-binding domain-containing protein [Chlamydiales bacterium]|nr:transporter substrate-binding domain-containing protein [Chlamydiales bacterium]
MRIVVLLCLALLSACSSSKEGSYSIGRDPTWFPLNLGQKTANVTAFSTALVQEIAKEEKEPLEIHNVGWDQLFEGLGAREYAGVFSSLPPNMENKDKFSFSDPFLFLGPVLVVRQKSEDHSLIDLEKSIVGINQFDDTILILQKYPSIMVELYSNMAVGLEDLAKGKIDGLLINNLEAHALVPHLYPGVLKIATPPLNDKGLRLLTIKGENEKLIQHFNRGLRKLRAKSCYKALREKFSVY